MINTVNFLFRKFDILILYFEIKKIGVCMKRFALIIFLLALLTVQSFANEHDGWGIGTAFYGGYGYGPGLLLKTPVLPLYWELIVSLGGIDQEMEPYFAVTLSGDYHFFEKNFPKNEKLDWFLGGGIVFSHSHYDGKNAFAGRIPIGISFANDKKFNFVFELAPTVGFFAWNSKIEFDYGMSGLFGICYWL
jgi:hypothetical protein